MVRRLGAAAGPRRAGQSHQPQRRPRHRVERAWQRNHQTLRSTIAAASACADTRGERFAITINGTTLRERKPAGELLNRWAAAAERGRTERLAQLGGLHILGMVSPDYRNGGRELVLTLEGLAVEPARAPLDHAHANPLALIRQLEHRVTTLGERAERLRAEHQDAILEGQRARGALDRPFKYAEQLADARRQQERIDQQIAGRHHERQDAERAAIAGVDADTAASIALAHRAHPDRAAPAAHGEPPTAGERDLESETAESLRLLRAAQARPIEEALRSPAAVNPAGRDLNHAPSRSARPRRDEHVLMLGTFRFTLPAELAAGRRRELRTGDRPA